MLVDGWIGEGDGFLLVFSITDSKGYGLLEKKRERIRKIKERSMPPMILVGNKCDLDSQRVVQKADATALAEAWTIEYVEASAKVQFNIYDAAG